MAEIEGMERRRTKKKRKKIWAQNEWDRTFLMRKGCLRDGEERMTVRSERREKGIANKCGQNNVRKKRNTEGVKV